MSENIVSGSEARQLAMLASILTDEESKRRIGALQEAQREHDAALNRLKIQEAANSQAVRDAQTRLDAAIEKERESLRRKDELDRREREMSDVHQALIAEKASWEEVRQKVDADQAARRERLNTDEARLIELSSQLDREKVATDEKFADAQNTFETYWAMVAELKAVMEKHGT